MTTNFHRPFLPMVMLSLVMTAPGCKHSSPLPAQLSSLKAPIAMLKKETDLVFVQENKRQPAHILYKRQDRYAFTRGHTDTPFKLEMIVNPLMRNPSVTARVEKSGKTVREFVAKKTATSILSEKKTTWAPARSKLALVIPYVNANEVVVVTTSYEWMDIRWLPPILMQEDAMPTMDAKLTVDVPYGITMHFKAAKDRTKFDYLPKSFPQEKPLWVQDDNRAGLGMRYSWSADVETMSGQSQPSNLLQILLSFESPAQNDAGQRFDSWNTVSSYLYHRIDRYDLPSSEIRAYAVKETRDLLHEEEKINHLLSFVHHNIEKRSAVGSFQEQDLQPATRTFARRFGTPSDIAILAKSLLSSIGVETDLIAAGDRRFYPELPDFYSPALFSSIILSYTSNGVTHYFDPEATKVPSDQLDANRQGQQALVLRPKNGTVFALPYDSAQKNLRTYSYQLWLSDDGVLEGEYSIDLLGFEAQTIKLEAGERLRSKSVAEVEAHLYGTQRTDFSLETVEYLNDSPQQGLRVSGLIKPRLLFKNGQGGYDLKLEKIIEPAFLALKDAHEKGFSSTTKISLFIGLPENYVANNMPSSQHLSFGGVEGRFFAEASTGQLIVEGVAMITMPVNVAGVRERLRPGLEAIAGFGSQNIAIHHGSLADGMRDYRPVPAQETSPDVTEDSSQEQGAQDASQEPPHEENS